MDPVSPKDVSASEDVNQPDALKKLCTEPSQCNCHFPENVSIDELGNSLSEFLLVQDGQILPSKSNLCQPLDKTDNPDAEMKHDFEDLDQTESAIATSEKCLFKCATFPCAGMKSSDAVPIDGEGCETGKNSYPRSISLPVSLHYICPSNTEVLLYIPKQWNIGFTLYSMIFCYNPWIDAGWIREIYT